MLMKIIIHREINYYTIIEQYIFDKDIAIDKIFPLFSKL